jgi:S-adenosylmethionine:tRNA-ribosyltransferase-isomerase (queuine synthetase)
VSVTTAQVQKSADDDPVHRKAKRFAKLLVDEIKLYNKAKVQEGKKNGDLYQRLKEDIEKSRAAYEKRYGSTAAAAGNYFDREIIQNLAENDSSLLGAGFSR